MKIEDYIYILLRDESIGITYFVYILSQMNYVKNNSIETMAILFKNGKLVLEYNENFTGRLQYNQFKYLLQHEILHITNKHHKRYDTNYTEIENNIAADLAINSILGKPPIDLVYPGIYPFKSFPVGCSYEEYIKHIKPNLDEKNQNGGNNTNDKQDKNQKDQNQNNKKFNFYEPHNLRRSDKDNLMFDTFINFIKKAAIQKTLEKEGEVSENFIERIHDVLPDNQFNWRNILRNWIGNSISFGITTNKKIINKKYRQFHGIIPGYQKIYLPKILVAIDTSGSINHELLERFIKIINSMEFYKILVQCDDKILEVNDIGTKKIDPYFEIKGRGDTNFIPVFEYAKKIHINNIIYLTDLYGLFPQKFNGKVLWVTTNYNKVPFGKTVVIK